MFHTRITEAWGAPAEVREAFLLEQSVELPSGLKLLCGRERASGIRRWIKFATTPADNAALAAEAAALADCAHPNIAALTHNGGTCELAWFAVEWQGEAPLDGELWQRLPAIDRLRLVPALISAVEALAVARVAVPGLGVPHLWVSPALHWLRLVGLSGATPEASSEAIASMRGAAARLIEEHALSSHAQVGETILPSLISKWGNNEETTLNELVSELDRALLMAVTADL